MQSELRTADEAHVVELSKWQELEELSSTFHRGLERRRALTSFPQLAIFRAALR